MKMICNNNITIDHSNIYKFIGKGAVSSQLNATNNK